MNHPAPAQSPTARAFTLVEILVSMTIIGFVVMGAAAITIQGLKVYYDDSNHLMVNKDMRKFTQAMLTDAAFANDFYIYDPATTAIPTGGNDAYVNTGMSGDDLLLVTTSTNPTTGVITDTKLIAYYRTVNDTTNNAGPLYRIEVDNLTDAGTTPIYTLWNTRIKPLIAGQTATFMTSVIGTAGYNNTSSTPNHLNTFYNAGSFVMVRAQIQERGYNGGSTANTIQTKAIDTYNLSIWPRG